MDGCGEAREVEKQGTCMRGLAIELESMPGLGGASRRLAGQLEENARALLLHRARLACARVRPCSAHDLVF
jgi:hypothetical protein